MAIGKRYGNEAENEAIIEKVAKVLRNTDYPTRKKIIIESDAETITTIKYEITELIVPTDTTKCSEGEFGEIRQKEDE